VIELGEALPKDKLLKMDLGLAHAGHGHGEFDPHVWLGIPQAIVMVEQIREKLSEKDPVHKDGYAKRAGEYIDKLKKIQEDGKKALGEKKDPNIISFHESLGYFAAMLNDKDRQRLNVVASIEPVAGTEPDPKRIENLVKLCKSKDTRLIAVEPQYPQNTAAATLRQALFDKEIKDAAFVVVDPIETVEPDKVDADYYEKKMRENIDNLAKSMK
jgi:ABC-type Zn uptake system ZnuABC Zn-binding protein ZnuA